MTPIELLARLSLLVAAALSVSIARGQPSYRPVSETLLLAVLLDAARRLSRGTIFDEPLLLAFPCLSASLAPKVFAGVPRWPLASVWMLMLCLGSSESGRAFLGSPERLYELAQFIGVITQAFWMLVGSRPATPTAKESDRSDSLARTATVILFVGDLASFAGPLAVGQLRRDWWLAQAQTVLLFLVFNTWQILKVREAMHRARHRDL